MPTILYHTTPIIFLRTKKTGSHSVKHCLKKYAEENQVSYLEVRSKSNDTLDTHRFISHMPAKDLAERLDVWDASKKFTFVRNPWQVIYSYFYFNKYTGPKHGWSNPENYDLRDLYSFLESLINIKGTTNFNKEIYSINDQIIADVYDISNIEKIMKTQFDQISVPRLNTQDYHMSKHELDLLDKYVYNDYEWEINEFRYTKPSLD
jgi:hypothetical protein